MNKDDGNNKKPAYVDLELDEDTHVDSVYVGFETEEGEERVLCEVSPPVSLSIQGRATSTG